MEFKDESKVLFCKLHPDAIIPSKRVEDSGYDVYALFDEDYNQGMRTIDYISSYLKFDEEKLESQSVFIPLKTHNEIVLLDNDKIKNLLLTLIEDSLKDLKNNLDNGENK